MTTWLPWIGLTISIATLLLTFWKFGREVHLDDKQAMLDELTRCRDRVKDLDDKYEKMARIHNELMEENRKLKEHNYSLMARITQLRNGDKS